MTEYIDREAAIKALCERSEPCFTESGEPTFKGDYIGAIASVPAADVVEVVRGKWMFDFALGGSNFYKCSECGRQECLLEKYNAEKYMPYCHCGARMDGGVDK